VDVPGLVVVVDGAAVPAPEAPTSAAVPGTPVVAVAPEAADAPAPVAADAPGGEVPVPTAAGTSGGTLSGGSDGTGREGSGSTPATSAVPAAAPAGPVATTAPAATVESATGEAAALPVGSQVARQVAVLGRGPDGAHTMTMVLTPETLGPVEVQVTVSKGSVELTLRGAHEHGRAALLDSLPDLRRDLESAGLTPVRLQVDRETGGQWLTQHSAQQNAGDQQSSGQRPSQQDGGERSRPWLRPADTTGSGPTPPSQRSTSSGVDVRV
jgi:flagellar hook-length control protein FliK